MDKLDKINAEEAWLKASISLQNELSPQVFERWIQPIKPVGWENTKLILAVPDDFFKSWVIDHYGTIILNCVKDATAETEAIVEFLTYTVTVPIHVSAVAATTAATPVKDLKSFQGFPSHNASFPAQESILNEKYTFDQFVVGPSNRFAHAASMAVAESPAKSYNPLFIYGPVGLGKTHLLQAIGQETLRRYPGCRVLYITSEKFTNQLINAIKTGTTIKFREKYRTVDCLLIDDIHFIAGKDATMEEFFHTFNSLYDNHKQIVASSDKSPKGISNMEERLVSRFEWGLVTDIQAPDFETRTAILRKKAERERLDIPDSVTSFIADKIKSNIRELEGALIRVVAYSKLVGRNVDESVAYEVLKDLIVENQGKITVDHIQRKVAQYYDIRPSDMVAKRRSRSVAFPRHVAMYLAREMTTLSFPEIGEQFGGRDHTTVLHAYEKIKKDIKRDSKIKAVIDKLADDIRNRRAGVE